MEILYPKNYVAPISVKPQKPATTALKAFIKTKVATKPKLVSELIDAVDAEYVKTNDEAYHWLPQDIASVCEEIDLEFRPVVLEPVLEPALEPVPK